MIDIDYFKFYNDHYGHQAGDNVLHRVAQIIRRCCRSEDYVGRYGGEEFIVVLFEDSEYTHALAKSILTQIRHESIPHEKSIVSDILTVSIGASSQFGSLNEGYLQAIARADKALYSAKKSGRNRVTVYPVSPDEMD